MDKPELPASFVVPITDENEAIRLVVFGEPGRGKTTLAMTFPRPLVLNADDGLVAVTVKADGKTLGTKVKVESYVNLQGLFFYARDHIDEWDTFVLDGIDELAFVLTNELIEMGNGYQARKHGAGYNPHPVMEFIPEQLEYQANQRQLHTFLNLMRGLGKPIVVTAGVREPDRERVWKRAPNLGPAAIKDLVRWGSVVGELVIAEVEGTKQHVLLCSNDDDVRESKTRFEALDPYVIEPTYDKLNELKAGK